MNTNKKIALLFLYTIQLLKIIQTLEYTNIDEPRINEVSVVLPDHRVQCYPIDTTKCDIQKYGIEYPLCITQGNSKGNWIWHSSLRGLHIDVNDNNNTNDTICATLKVYEPQYAIAHIEAILEDEKKINNIKLSCEVSVERIHRIEIQTRSHKIYIDEMEPIWIQGYTISNDTFSTMEGIFVKWIINNDKIVEIIPLKDTKLYISSVYNRMSKEIVNGEQYTDRILLRGIKSGKINICCIIYILDNDKVNIKELKSSCINLLILEPLIIKPSSNIVMCINNTYTIGLHSRRDGISNNNLSLEWNYIDCIPNCSILKLDYPVNNNLTRADIYSKDIGSATLELRHGLLKDDDTLPIGYLSINISIPTNICLQWDTSDSNYDCYKKSKKFYNKDDIYLINELEIFESRYILLNNYSILTLQLYDNNQQYIDICTSINVIVSNSSIIELHKINEYNYKLIGINDGNTEIQIVDIKENIMNYVVLYVIKELNIRSLVDNMIILPNITDRSNQRLYIEGGSGDWDISDNKYLNDIELYQKKVDSNTLDLSYTSVSPYNKYKLINIEIYDKNCINNKINYILKYKNINEIRLLNSKDIITNIPIILEQEIVSDDNTIFTDTSGLLQEIYGDELPKKILKCENTIVGGCTRYTLKHTYIHDNERYVSLYGRIIYNNTTTTTVALLNTTQHIIPQQKFDIKENEQVLFQGDEYKLQIIGGSNIVYNDINIFSSTNKLVSYIIEDTNYILIKCVEPCEGIITVKNIKQIFLQAELIIYCSQRLEVQEDVYYINSGVYIDQKDIIKYESLVLCEWTIRGTTTDDNSTVDSTNNTVNINNNAVDNNRENKVLKKISESQIYTIKPGIGYIEMWIKKYPKQHVSATIIVNVDLIELITTPIYNNNKNEIIQSVLLYVNNNEWWENEPLVYIEWYYNNTKEDSEIYQILPQEDDKRDYIIGRSIKVYTEINDTIYITAKVSLLYDMLYKYEVLQNKIIYNNIENTRKKYITPYLLLPTGIVNEYYKINDTILKIIDLTKNDINEPIKLIKSSNIQEINHDNTIGEWIGSLYMNDTRIYQIEIRDIKYWNINESINNLPILCINNIDNIKLNITLKDKFGNNFTIGWINKINIEIVNKELQNLQDLIINKKRVYDNINMIEYDILLQEQKVKEYSLLSNIPKEYQIYKGKEIIIRITIDTIESLYIPILVGNEIYCNRESNGYGNSIGIRIVYPLNSMYIYNTKEIYDKSKQIKQKKNIQDKLEKLILTNTTNDQVQNIMIRLIDIQSNIIQIDIIPIRYIDNTKILDTEPEWCFQKYSCDIYNTTSCYEWSLRMEKMVQIITEFLAKESRTKSKKPIQWNIIKQSKDIILNKELDDIVYNIRDCDTQLTIKCQDTIQNTLPCNEIRRILLKGIVDVNEKSLLSLKNVLRYQQGLLNEIREESPNILDKILVTRYDSILHMTHVFTAIVGLFLAGVIWWYCVKSMIEKQ